MDIKTNNVPRALLYPLDLTDKERAEFDAHQLAEDAQFFRYRGAVYPVADFVRIVPRANVRGFEHGADDASPLLAWDGIATDSYFSAVVIRYTRPDWDSVIVGSASW